MHNEIGGLAKADRLVSLWLGFTMSVLFLLFYIPFLAASFRFSAPSLLSLAIAIAAGMVSVVWFELLKYTDRSGYDNAKFV